MIIAITSGSRSRAAKLSAALRRELSDSNTLTAGFRYPVHKIAKMFGWDERHDEKGKKLINTLYNAGVEYDRNIWIKKMEGLIKKVSRQKQTIIISDLDCPEQARQIKNMDNVRLIVCGDNEALRKHNLIDVYVESDRPVDEIVKEIMKEVR